MTLTSHSSKGQPFENLAKKKNSWNQFFSRKKEPKKDNQQTNHNDESQWSK